MKRNKGVTIIELMVAIAVLAILASVAVPSYGFLITTNQMATQTNRLLASLLYARSEAAKRGESVSVCQSTNGTTCGGTAEDWSDGWIVFVDVASDGSYDSGTDTIVKVEGAMPGGHSVASTSFPNYILYRPDGSSNKNGSFLLCSHDNDAYFTRQLNVASTGRPRISDEGTCS